MILNNWCDSTQDSETWIIVENCGENPLQIPPPLTMFEALLGRQALSLCLHLNILHLISSLVAQMVKNLPAMQRMGLIPGWEDPLEKGMATPVSLPEEFHGQRSLMDLHFSLLLHSRRLRLIKFQHNSFTRIIRTGVRFNRDTTKSLCIQYTMINMVRLSSYLKLLQSFVFFFDWLYLRDKRPL